MRRTCQAGRGERDDHMHAWSLTTASSVAGATPTACPGSASCWATAGAPASAASSLARWTPRSTSARSDKQPLCATCFGAAWRRISSQPSSPSMLPADLGSMTRSVAQRGVSRAPLQLCAAVNRRCSALQPPARCLFSFVVIAPGTHGPAVPSAQPYGTAQHGQACAVSPQRKQALLGVLETIPRHTKADRE